MTGTPLVATEPELDRDRWRAAFIAFVTVGLILASVLGIREVVNESVIQLDDVRASDEGVVPVQAQVLARNTSGATTYCVQITITATDRDGLSLASVVAEPTTGDGTLGPGRSANFVGVFGDELTQQEVDEELESFYGFVTDSQPC